MAMATLVFLSATVRAQDPTATAGGSGLAQEVWKASGGENWERVKRIRFTFVVEQDGKALAHAEHDWDVAAGKDHVKWKDKDVTVDLMNPAQDGDGKAGYARWVNDSYWLLAPLKLRDPGVTTTEGGAKEAEGASGPTLQLSFGKVGLTPTDKYLFYLDPQTKLPRAWDYIPESGEGMHATWEKYQNFGGLQLATEHHFGNKVIRFTDVEVTAN